MRRKRTANTTRATIGILTAFLTLAGCTSDGEPIAVGAFTAATYDTLPGRFDEVAAETALRAAYPDAETNAFDTAIAIANAACLVVHYELTADGRSAVYALRQTEHGEDVMAVALAAGCTNDANAEAFVAAVPKR